MVSAEKHDESRTPNGSSRHARAFTRIRYHAHNDEEAMALYERAADALECPPDRVMRLEDGALRAAVLETADDNDLAVDDI